MIFTSQNLLQKCKKKKKYTHHACMHTHCLLICQSSIFFSARSVFCTTCTHRHTNKKGCDGFFCFCFWLYRFVFEELIFSFTTMVAKTFTVEEGWEYMKNNGILKLIRILEGLSEPSFTIAESMMLYTYSFFFLFFFFFFFLFCIEFFSHKITGFCQHV